MAYISSDGVIGRRRSPWKFSTIVDFFFGILNLVVLLFRTLFQPDLTRHGTGYTSSYRASSDGRSPPGPPRRRMGGFGAGSSDCSSAPMAGGG